MKTHLLAFVLAMLILHEIFGKIVNGYEKDSGKVRLSILHLRQLLADNPQFTTRQQRKLNVRITELTEFMVYHQLTEMLLMKFRVIAPDLYAAVDTLRDHRGRSVDVYVRFIRMERSETKSLGAVSLAVTQDEQQLCVSRYGNGTAAVTISAFSNSLAVLSHEFGHLTYVVPNLGTYVRYYTAAYGHSRSGAWLGHECGDPGGRSALKYETGFRNRYRRYLREKAGGKVLPFAYLSLAREKIKRSFESERWRIADVDVGHFPF